jgi:hypothetical protein
MTPHAGVKTTLATKRAFRGPRSQAGAPFFLAGCPCCCSSAAKRKRGAAISRDIHGEARPRSRISRDLDQLALKLRDAGESPKDKSSIAKTDFLGGGMFDASSRITEPELQALLEQIRKQASSGSEPMRLSRTDNSMPTERPAVANGLFEEVRSDDKPDLIRWVGGRRRDPREGQPSDCTS